MAQDKLTISNEPHEIKHAAVQLNVPEIAIHLAKHFLDTNNRKAIYDWIDENRGKVLNVKI